MKYIQLLLITIAFCANFVFARVTSPVKADINEALNYKVIKAVSKPNSNSTSKSQTPNNRNLASEKKQNLEDYQGEEEEFQEELEDLEDQDRDVASEQDSASDSPRIRYWKY
jgi:hypothetical protein